MQTALGPRTGSIAQGKFAQTKKKGSRGETRGLLSRIALFYLILIFLGGEDNAER